MNNNYKNVVGGDNADKKRKTIVKIAVAAILSILITVAVIGFIFGSTYRKKQDCAVSATEESMIITPVSASDMRISSEKSSVVNKYNLTATVEPVNSSNKTVMWSIEWSDPHSDWASGKDVSDYIELNSDGLTATVASKTAFSEQAVITVRSAANEGICATCTVDYVERLAIPHNGAYMDIRLSDSAFSFNKEITAAIETIYSNVGTLRGELAFDKLTVSLSQDIREFISSQVEGYNDKYHINTLLYDLDSGQTVVNIPDPLNFFSVATDEQGLKAELLQAFISACDGNGRINIRSSFRYSYKDMTVQTGHIIGNFAVNTDSVVVDVSNISIDISHIVF